MCHIMREEIDDLERLARMAARLAGRDPDEHVELRLADTVVFSDPLWRYDDFMIRAEKAYEILGGASLVQSDELEERREAKS